ncbi:NUDIX hydrolase [Candidatus Uhrbacteria bacterium]|nr:NUDIX hydrolase [Candidatus Uhrbacteria bacterium]
MILDPQKPGVGVAAVIWQDERRERLLLGLGHDPATRDSIYAMPGGHWDPGESLIEAAQREAREEAGVEIDRVTFVCAFDFFREDKQRSYVSIWFQSIWAGGEPTVMESANKRSWGWYTPAEALALPLWELDRMLITRVTSGVQQFETNPKLVTVDMRPRTSTVGG